MTNMQSTSLAAYEEVCETLGARQTAVLAALDIPMTNTELAKKMGYAINRITPRIFELRELGLVRRETKRPCKITGRMAIVWRKTIDQEYAQRERQLELFT